MAPPAVPSPACWTALLLATALLAYAPAAVIGALPQALPPSLQLQDPLPSTPDGHCELAVPGWCGPYYSQVPTPAPPAPHGSLTCPANCNRVGVCDADTGRCRCPAGYDGADCTAGTNKRPCANMGPDKRDLGWLGIKDWSHTRCAGICDDDIGMCYCPAETKYGRVEAPAGSPPGASPVRRGRPMFWCQPSTNAEGKKVPWGQIKYEDLFGKQQGWCEADLPKFRCPCRIDGFIGDLCNIPVEQNCINQCSGRGDCLHGFCKCYDAYYGHDCSQRRAGVLPTPDDSMNLKPWLKPVLTPVAAAVEPLPPRNRPLIYVYDLRPEFTTDILEYRIERAACVYRHFQHGNRSELSGNNYAIESVMHELMLTSPHRTFNPEEADYFYVPARAACLFDVFGWNTRPSWPRGVHGPRPMAASNMLKAAQEWVANAHPYFNRSGGADHIWLMPHDEGSCYVPRSVWPGIQLSHWGRTDFPHTAYSAYHGDNYSWEIKVQEQPLGWLNSTSRTHPCFDPEKDLVIPVFLPPHVYRNSPYMAGKPLPRTTLLFFKGDLGQHRDDKACIYSRCIRQRLANISRDQEWPTKHRSLYGTQAGMKGDYGNQLASSIFCLVLPGDGFSTRFEDSILRGCIPVIIMDDTMAPFETLFDFSAFTLRVMQANLENLMSIVEAVTPARILEMQHNVDKMWHRYRYLGLTQVDGDTLKAHEESASAHGGVLPKLPGREYALTRVDDAFSTIMQWLLSRIPATRKAQDRPYIWDAPVV